MTKVVVQEGQFSAECFGKIAVIGMAGRFPGAADVGEFWENLKEGKEGITFFSHQDLVQAGVPDGTLRNPKYVRAKGVYKGTFLFDAAFFGYGAREAELLDPQQRVFLECAWESLENAGYDPLVFPGRIGLFAGSGITQYLFDLLSNPETWQTVSAFALPTYADRDFLATRVGYKLNLRGPCITIQTACSTSLVNVVMACQSLLTYQSDMALAGGVWLEMQEESGYLYEDGGIISPDGRCRPFDASAAGTVGGSGAGVVVLKRLENALADRDTVLAVILGFGLNNDGAARAGFMAPGVDGQVAVSSDAIAMAAINPETIGYVECHGTGTAIGDPIEIEALTRSFRAYTQKQQFCAVGSVKSNIGHTGAAAGIAGFIKTVLSVRHGIIPPTLHFQKPNPRIEFVKSPFYVATTPIDWNRGEHPRRAGVTSLGAGGTNAHVILEEASGPKTRGRCRPWQLLVWSAKSNSALQKMSENLAAHLKRNVNCPISDTAYTLQTGRRAFQHQKILVCKNHQDAIASLDMESPLKVYPGLRREPRGKIVFLFPGQGSQHIYMAQQIYAHESAFRRNIDLCAELLREEIGHDVRDLIYPLAELANDATVALNEIQFTTPILFVIEYALAKLWMEWGVHPDLMFGHSTGEYVAACLAGVFSLKDALKLVSVRGRLIEQQPSGSMMAVMLAPEEIRSWIKETECIAIAAINGPLSCVVSGDSAAVVELSQRLSRRNLPWKMLQVSHAAHSPMMEPMLEDFRRAVRQVRLSRPQLPYVSGVTGTWIKPEEPTLPEYWVRHLREPVQCSAGLQKLLTERNSIFLEVGPGRTLSRFASQHPERSPEQRILSTLPFLESEVQDDLQYLLTTVGRLWLEGVQIDWIAFHAGENCARVPLPTYPFERQYYRLRPTRTREYVHTAADDVGSKTPAPQSAEGNESGGAPAFSSDGREKSIDSVRQIAPRNDLERAISCVWQSMLGIGALGVNDNFYDLGGDSLLAIQLATRLRELLEVDVSVRDIHEFPTVALLAEAVVQALAKSIDSENFAGVIAAVDLELDHATPKK